MRKFPQILIAALMFAASISACCAQEPSPQQSATSALQGMYETKFEADQPIKPGFLVGIFVSTSEGPEDLSGTQVVDPAGGVSLKLIGRFNLKDLKPSEANGRLAARFKQFIKEPTVEVVIMGIPRPIVNVGGAVLRTGSLPISEGTTLAEALATVGYLDTADLTRIRHLRRTSPDQPKPFVTDIKEFDLIRWLRPASGEKPDETQNISLEDRDTIYVPFKTTTIKGSATVEGDVVRPGAVQVRYGVGSQLREVLSQAGGLNPTASYSINVRRAGQQTPLAIDFAKMMNGDPLHNVGILPDDVIFVSKLVEGQFVYVNGALARPGPQPFRGSGTLSQAIGMAGGLLINAKDRDGRIIRKDPSGDLEKTQFIVFDYKQIRQGKMKDHVLMAGDIVEILPGEPRTRTDWLSVLPTLLSAAVLLRQ